MILHTVWYIRTTINHYGNADISGIQYNRCSTVLDNVSHLLYKMKRWIQLTSNLRINFRLTKYSNSALLHEFQYMENMRYPLTTEFPKIVKSLAFVFCSKKK